MKDERNVARMINVGIGIKKVIALLVYNYI